MAKKAAEHPKRNLMGIFNANRAAEVQALIRSLEEALGAHSEGKCRVEFVDVMEQAERAMLQLFVTPMLVKELPATAGC